MSPRAADEEEKDGSSKRGSLATDKRGFTRIMAQRAHFVSVSGVTRTGVWRGSHDPAGVWCSARVSRPRRSAGPKVSRAHRRPWPRGHSRSQSTIRRRETFGRAPVRGQETRAQQTEWCSARVSRPRRSAGPKVSRAHRRPSLRGHFRSHSAIRTRETFGRVIVRGRETRAQQEWATSRRAGDRPVPSVPASGVIP